MTFKKGEKKGGLQKALEQKKKTDPKRNNFRVSFEDYDSSQKFGSSFRDWQKVGLLSAALETLHGYCQRPLWAQVDGDKFGVYGSFPPSDKTEYTYPEHVTLDAHWAKIHITGAAVLIGHIVEDTFYVVFLDKTHKFYLTKRVTQN